MRSPRQLRGGSRVRFCFLVAVGVSGLLSCQAQPEPDPAQDAGRIPIATYDEFCSAFREAECSRLEVCCAASEVAFERDVCEREFGYISSRVAWCGSGQAPATFDGAAAAECLALRARLFDGCDFVRTDDPIAVMAARVCERVAIFMRDPEAPCDAAPCFAPPGMVSVCQTLYDSPGPFFCSTPTERAGAGEFCGYCDFGLYCRNDGHCGAPLADGAQCVQDYECSSNECTDVAPDVTDRRCEPVRTIGWMECEIFTDPRVPHEGPYPP